MQHTVYRCGYLPIVLAEILELLFQQLLEHHHSEHILLVSSSHLVSQTYSFEELFDGSDVLDGQSFQLTNQRQR
jgi:hypothetical protein